MRLRKAPNRGRTRRGRRRTRAGSEAVRGAAGGHEQRAEHDAVARDHPGEARPRESWENVRSNAGKATFTIDRSSEAMKAPKRRHDEDHGWRSRAEWSGLSDVRGESVRSCNGP